MGFNFWNKSKFQLLPLVFDAVKGDPFHEEDYQLDQQQGKIQFYYLKQNEYQDNFARLNQYVIWTLKDNIYRVFIDKFYYEKFSILYQPEINIYFIKYIFSSLKIYNSMLLNRYLCMFFGFLFYALNVFVYFKFNFFLGYLKLTLMFLLFLLLLICSFFVIRYQNNIFLDKKKKLLKEFKNNMESFLGKEITDKILSEHKEYLTLISNKKQNE
ncbi:MAG: hypothetical protein Q8764_00315 [Pigeon pea little leaf phytoplasma]|uniref:Transmembrane protein n=1 Tax=Candidatus Phytoplasma fabacearum TaxID=2982628 RepID=A0ABU8ZT05_9MOLU|nr:hypothetical protein ['Bituminaria bituminosa' little leaf phytoplasma]MDV3149002.1 hypothetical protein [Pigeon pea little leaf phytoplasma]MDO7983663.1 hypothetical protein ['Bituminaria bituminosa' little leaf phytoplasma]MDO8023708.1 hypothetical protein ['Bituminaria bituminosa' little leaf phytoplasma]MDO8030562.1 hypothetical protein ['Bituminaria bituminosa' little leaf phytoplasma]MDV3154149.1 hypothetical protein [Pigeon pea little leaf phytoplasma]